MIVNNIVYLIKSNNLYFHFFKHNTFKKLEYMNNKNNNKIILGKPPKNKIGCDLDESVIIIPKRLN